MANFRPFAHQFRQHRLAWYSWWLLILITITAFSAPIIANDKPVFVYYDNQPYMPIWVDYPETTFGGIFETSADYQDPVVRDLIQQRGFFIMPPIEYGEHTLSFLVDKPHPAPPSGIHWLGTDGFGHDVLARLLYGLRISLWFAFGLTCVGGIIGVIVGAVMGYFGGVVDLLGQRFMEIWLGLPQLFMLMILVSLFEPSVWVLFVLMALFGWTALVSVTRVQFLQLRSMPFVITAKNLGVPSHIIISRHILPFVMASVLANLPFLMIANISALTALDFLGFGLPVGSASLGELLLQGKNHLDAPHLLLASFLTLSVLLTLFVFIAEGVKEAMDVKR